MSAPTLPGVVAGPGVYDLPAVDYHADPVEGGSLSSTGARKLLPPSCPALFRHWLDSGEAPRAAWDLGTAAHKLVLGVGPELVLIDRDRWDTKEIKQQVHDVREAGGVPLKREPYEAVHAMAEAIRRHPVAHALLTQPGGRAEATIVWRDQQAGVWCRALIDHLPPVPAADGRLLLPDYKTGRSAAPDRLGRTIADFGYHVQLAWYLMGLRAIGYADDNAQALLVMQETTAPYLVTVSQPDTTAMRLGAIRCRQALDLYAECVATDRWPGYGDEVVVTELPPWETRELDGQVW